MVSRFIRLFGFVLLASSTVLHAEKPNLWIYTDMSDPRVQRSGGHPYNDPDDICTLAALLLEANRFNIEAVVYKSNHRKGLGPDTDFVSNIFADAYAHDQPHLDAALGGYQPEINFIRSSLRRTDPTERFDANGDYVDLSDLPTVQALVDYATENPVYVLLWGPVTEGAIAAKHCLTTGNDAALENMTFIAHWTRSYIAQGTPEAPHRVANCNDDAVACQWFHDVAGRNRQVKYDELGSIGQTGIVNGSAGYPHFADFRKSRLGQIFVHAKNYGGKPDQSDGATFWVLIEELGPTLDDLTTDGTFSQAREENARDKFLADGHAILDDLRLRSAAAAMAGNPFSPAIILEHFTYVYQFIRGNYGMHLPLPATVTIQSPNGAVLHSADYAPGSHDFAFMQNQPVGDYPVTITHLDITRQFKLTVFPGGKAPRDW
ncbi:MAG: hypothetical protein SynsKO_43320 [Synoicihabitans sp.]